MCKIHCEAGGGFWPLGVIFVFCPVKSHTVVSDRNFFFASSRAQDVEDPAWLEIPGPYVSGHQILSQLTLALFIMIYNLVRSWLCGPRAEGDGVLFVQKPSGFLSGTDTWRVSLHPRPRTLPQGQGTGRPEGGGAQRQSCMFTGCWWE